MNSQNITSSLSGKRDSSIDLVKTIAILGVIFIHTCSAALSAPIKSFGFISALFLGSAARASVPLFFMCSGALLLKNKGELSLKRLYLRNIARIICAMLFWAVLYKIYHLWQQNTLSLSSLIFGIKEVLLFKQEFHFYYLHICLILYALLPILQVFVSSASRSCLRYALAVWFFLGIFYPTVKTFWPISQISGMPGSQWLINMTYASLGYALLGWYLKHYTPSRFCSLILTLVGFAFTYACSLIFSLRSGHAYLNFLEGMSLGPMLLAAGIFSLCRNVSLRENSAISRAVSFFSKASFCVYLTHIFVLYTFTKHSFTVDIAPYIFSIPLLAILNLLICCIFYFILSKIPLLRKWLI